MVSACNAPLRGGKGSLNEGGTNVCRAFFMGRGSAREPIAIYADRAVGFSANVL